MNKRNYTALAVTEGPANGSRQNSYASGSRTDTVVSLSGSEEK